MISLSKAMKSSRNTRKAFNGYLYAKETEVLNLSAFAGQEWLYRRFYQRQDYSVNRRKFLLTIVGL